MSKIITIDKCPACPYYSSCLYAVLVGEIPDKCPLSNHVCEECEFKDERDQCDRYDSMETIRRYRGGEVSLRDAVVKCRECGKEKDMPSYWKLSGYYRYLPICDECVMGKSYEWIKKNVSKGDVGSALDKKQRYEYRRNNETK